MSELEDQRIDRESPEKEEDASITLSGADLLDNLFDLEAFHICGPLDRRAFIKSCRERGISINTELLEQFEKKDLFWPLFRIRFPVRILRTFEDGSFEEAEVFEEEELRSGRVVREYVRPHRYNLASFAANGYVHSPERQKFEPWGSFSDEQGKTAVGSYYSPFQVYTLAFQLNATTQVVNLALLADYSDEDFEQHRASLGKKADLMIEGRSRSGNPRFDAVILAQAISTRYYPSARSDARTIQTPGDWDWHGYARAWSPADVLERLGIGERDVRRYFRMLDSALSRDPLKNWDDLLQFVNRRQRDKLKGAALYGDTIRTMRNMFGLLFKDLTGKELTPLRGPLKRRYSRNARAEDTEEPTVKLGKLKRDVQLLEFVVNRYGLNPRPALVLYVEGKGEEIAVPRLVERIWCVALSSCRIEVRNLSGVTGFTGSKRDRYGALERVIEEHHFNQTSAFIILDNEGRRVHKLRKKLSTKPSRYVEGRTVIRREFIHIWKRNVEFDNFSDAEIAKALTLTSEGRHEFTDEEVAGVAATFGKKGDPLSRLYNEKLDYDLPKPEFLQKLFDQVENYDEKNSRPLLVILYQVLELAILNHQPTFVETWDTNQTSGYLGHPTEGEDPLDGRFRELEKIQEHL